MGISDASTERLAKRILFSHTLHAKTTPRPNAPVVVVIPGFWEGYDLWKEAANAIALAGYESTIMQLPSTGTKPPENATMHDDIYAIREVLEDLLEREEKEIVLVMHSAGGFLGSNAIEGLSLGARKAQGKPGGVRRLLFLSAILLSEGAMHTPASLYDFRVGDIWTLWVGVSHTCIRKSLLIPRLILTLRPQPDGSMVCKHPETNLFNDLSPEAANDYLDKLSYQPASGWDGRITYTGWKQIPSIYLICKNDRILSEAQQRDMAGMAGSEIRECEAGHMVQCSMPSLVAECVKAAAGEEVDQDMGSET